MVIPEVAIPGTPEHEKYVDAVNGLINTIDTSALKCAMMRMYCLYMQNETGDDETISTPDTHEGDFVKLKGGQGYRDKDGDNAAANASDLVQGAVSVIHSAFVRRPTDVNARRCN